MGIRSLSGNFVWICQTCDFLSLGIISKYIKLKFNPPNPFHNDHNSHLWNNFKITYDDIRKICMLKKTFLYFRLRPIYYHSLTTKHEFVNTLDEVQNSRAKYEINIIDLRRKIGQLTSEVERLQSDLVRNPWQKCFCGVLSLKDKTTNFKSPMNSFNISKLLASEYTR